MDKQEARDLIKAIGSLDKTIATQIVAYTKEMSAHNRKIDVLNENLTKLNDKIGTYIQLQQH